MQNRLDLWSLKVDDNAIKLNIIYKYSGVRKITPSKALKGLIGVKWMVWIGEWLNRQKVRIPRIACDDASTHGKFMSLYKKSIKVEWNKDKLPDDSSQDPGRRFSTATFGIWKFQKRLRNKIVDPGPNQREYKAYSIGLVAKENYQWGECSTNADARKGFVAKGNYMIEVSFVLLSIP